MKFLLVLSLVLVGIWLWRSNRRANPKLKPKSPEAAQAPLETVGCILCSVHVPVLDAVQGKDGPYCCLEHRQRAEP